MTRKHKAWIPKEALRVTYKGQQPRALMWKLEIYKEWFEYAKLHGKYPKEFGNLLNYETFEDWWRPPNFAADLFLEPYVDKSIQVVDCKTYKAKPNKLVIELDLNRTQNQLKLDFRVLIEKANTATKYVPIARFQPSKPMQQLRLKNAEHEHNVKKNLPIRLDIPRKVFVLTQQGLTQAEIAYRLGFYKGVVNRIAVTNEEVYTWKKETTGRANKNKTVFSDGKDGVCAVRYNSAIRRVNRNLRQCEAIFKNIEKGTFP